MEEGSVRRVIPKHLRALTRSRQRGFTLAPGYEAVFTWPADKVQQ